MSFLGAAIEQLDKFTLPLSGRSAVVYLQSLLDASQTEGMFRYFFPQEYTQWECIHSNGENPLETRRAAELEFFRLVDDRLFPLYDVDTFWDSESEEHSEFLEDYIPIRTFGWCTWQGEGDIEDYPFEIQSLMYLVDENLHAEVQSDLSRMDSTSAQDFVIAHTPTIGLDQIDFEQLQNLCEQEETPLKHLGTALIHASGCSNNIFLDCWDTEMIYEEDRCWSIATLKFWAQEWKDAAPVLNQIEAVVNYLCLSQTHFERVFELWNLCTKA
ncbi:hypothetical protein ACQ4M3_24315 [Leptolyngbya sp. AN03gr2]|uniref:hypothetical protein n=1 Tax=unclassified Leptolyngbya TaxID=2650499 RepID=UPI003D31AD97